MPNVLWELASAKDFQQHHWGATGIRLCQGICRLLGASCKVFVPT